jgi:hypothetical protein
MTDIDRETQNHSLADVLAAAKKMGLCITAAANIRRQLDSLNQDLGKEGNPNEAVQAAVGTFEKVFRPLEEDVVPKDFGAASTRENALRGGSLNQQLLSLGSAISSFPAAPTKAELFLLNEISRKVEALAERVNQLIKVDLPGLNKVLEANKRPPLKVPEEIKP